MDLNKDLLKKSLCLVLIAQLLLTTSAVNIPQTEKSPGPDDEFSIAVLPDTQYYTSEKNGGKKEMFSAQTQWIAKNAAKENIRYVIHLGDISDNGEMFPQQWVNAAESMYLLEKPQAGYPQGIPYGMAVGNHDQTKSQFPLSGKTDQYNKYFGIEHFKGKKWYGGHYRDNNDSHYDLFEAGGYQFITVFLEYDAYDEDIEGLNKWCSRILEKYADRKAILVSHSIVHFNKTTGTNEKGFPKFSKQGQRVFDRLKSFPNVFLTLSGHVGDNGEGYRQDGYAGNVIKSLLSDYQSRPEGGHGLMRLMKFSKSQDLISVRTFSPVTGDEEADADSKFTLPWFHHTTVARYQDYNNDQLTDLCFFTNGKWKIAGTPDVSFGQAGDIAAPADYNGDGKTELAVFRPAEGKFYFQDGKSVALGAKGDIPVCGDWDGDGFADLAVYRPSNLTWYFNGLDSIKFGHKNGIPVPADYNGDGKADMAVFRPSTGEWLIGFNAPLRFGQAGDIPVPGNYHLGGKASPAVLRAGKIYLQDKTVLNADQANPSDLVNILPGVRQLINSVSAK